MRDEMVEWLQTIIVSLVIALIITTFIKPTIVKNCSMSPTLEENDFLIINRFLYKRGTPERGDIVVFRSNLKTETGKQKLLIKRVIALPGDKIVITDGKIYLNGSELEESYIKNEYTMGDTDLLIPENEIFVMGDNRSNSLDSRDGILGLVDLDTVMGKAFIRLFPFSRIGLLN
ncbi:MAG TPA: signal peptidase I [Oscillospiraceae bacterium]|nr:signal peptidase I [Oscillospiraceae bacterium]